MEFFLVRIFPYSLRMRENTDQKKLRIWTLFTQWDAYSSIKGFWYHLTIQYLTSKNAVPKTRLDVATIFTSRLQKVVWLSNFIILQFYINKVVCISSITMLKTWCALLYGQLKNISLLCQNSGIKDSKTWYFGLPVVLKLQSFQQYIASLIKEW